MKSLLITLIFGLFFQVIYAQTVSIDDAQFHVNEAHSPEYPEYAKKEKVRYTLPQLTGIITNKLKSSELLRQNYSNKSLTLELLIDEDGKIYSSKIADRSSSIMSVLILDVVENINEIDLENLRIYGITKLKIPIHYFL